MNRQSAITPLGETFALVMRPAALLAWLVLAAVSAAQTFAMEAVLDESGGERDYAMAGLVSLASGLVAFVIWVTLQFQLARRLGDDEGMPGKARFWLWLGLTLLTSTVMAIWSGAIPYLWLRSGQEVALFSYLAPLGAVLLRVLLFPVVVRTITAAHDGNALHIGATWSALWSRRAGWLAIYLALALGTAALGWLPELLSALTGLEDRTMTGLFGAAINTAGRVLLLLYAIATYRAFRREAVSEASVFA